ncbi:MAG: CusA/CzcA family heavy metal efflux RND transporter [Planctomycetes bacterium]|nr:CusA/CzcA family heavy metal efflux RND transporter [Planctomycetota bacterium]
MLERLLRFSIANRWTIVVFGSVAAALGLRSLSRLPIDAVPDITNNQVQVTTVFPALTPAEIEKQITFPVETALAGIPGLEFTRSLSRNGFSQVQAVFADDVDLYFARQQISERLGQTKDSLPPGAEPALGPVATGLGEIYMYAVDYEHPDGKGARVVDGEAGWQKDGSYLTAEGKRLANAFERSAYLREVQDWIIRPQLKNVRNIADVDSLGGYQKQYDVQPDFMKLVSYKLTFADLIEALERNNVSTGAGYVEHKGEYYLVRAAGRFENPEQIAAVAIGARGGVPIRVRDVAKVGIGKELRYGAASVNGREAVIGTALMLIGANTRTAATAVDAKMDAIRRSLPADVRAETMLNRTKLVNATIHTVEKNLFEGAALVIVVLFVLLGNIRAALITALAIPMSMLLTAIGMDLGKISGNLMSLGAIDFGLIVDGAVIIVENSLRHLAERQHQLGRVLTLPERLKNVRAATKEMILPSAFGQAIIMTVYIPILALTGTEGKMFHPMAITVIFALAAAFVLSLTLVPALVAIVISGRVAEKENVVVRMAQAAHRPTLEVVLRIRWVVVGLALVAFAGACFLFTRLGSEFVPTLDEKDMDIEVVRIASTSITQSVDMQLDLERTIKERFPEVVYAFSKAGTAALAADPMPLNAADCYLVLKPQEEWPNPNESKAQLVQRIDTVAQEHPGANYGFSQPIEMRFNELIAGIRSDVAVKVFGDDFDEMLPAANRIAAVLRGIGGSADVKVEQIGGVPVMSIDADREALARYGLSMADVQDVIATAIGGRHAGLVFEGDRRFDLVVRLPEETRSRIESIEALPIPVPRQDGRSQPSDDGGVDRDDDRGGAAPFIPLGSIARVSIAEGPNEISRENGKRLVIVQANVRGRDIGSYIEEAKRKIDSNVKLAAGNWLEWGGQFENLEAARRRLAVVVPVCFALIFLLLFGTFRSVKHALLVFTCVPLALTGGIIALWLRGMPFSISAAVGFIALSGVAVLNGLVMVTFINQLRSKGMGLEEAIVTGSLTRLRPVLMTALVASLGFMPMAIARGTGAEVQKPLATVVIGGLVSATLLTLVVLPALYRMWHRTSPAMR